MLTSLPGNLPADTSRTAGFLKVGFSLPVSLPGNFPDLPGLRPFAISPKTDDNGSGFWCQGETNNKSHHLFGNS